MFSSPLSLSVALLLAIVTTTASGSTCGCSSDSYVNSYSTITFSGLTMDWLNDGTSYVVNFNQEWDVADGVCYNGEDYTYFYKSINLQSFVLYYKASSSRWVIQYQGTDDYDLAYCEQDSLDDCSNGWYTFNAYGSTTDNGLTYKQESNVGYTYTTCGNAPTPQPTPADAVNGCGCGGISERTSPDYETITLSNVDIVYYGSYNGEHQPYASINAVYTITDNDCINGLRYWIGDGYDYVHGDDLPLYIQYSSSNSRFYVYIVSNNINFALAYCSSSDISNCGSNSWYVYDNTITAQYYLSSTGSVSVQEDCSTSSGSGGRSDSDSSSSKSEEWWHWLLVGMAVGIGIFGVIMCVVVGVCYHKKSKNDKANGYTSMGL